MQKASLSSATLILTVTAIGTGVLALPYAVRQLGWALGASVIVTTGILNIVSLEILIEAGLKFGIDSYGGLLGVCQGRRTAMLLDMIILLDCFGAIVSYWIFMGQILPPLLQKVLLWLGFQNVIEFLSANSVLPAVAVMVFLVSLPRSISSIGSCSSLGILSIVYLSALLVCRAFSSTAQDILCLPAFPEEKWSLHGAKTFTNACAMIIFSFLCQCNVFLVVTELERPTICRLRKASLTRPGHAGLSNLRGKAEVTRMSTIFQIICYMVIAMCGYISFGTATADNVFMSFPKNDLWVDAGRAFLCLALCISIPLNTYPTRATLISLVSHLLLSGDQQGQRRVSESDNVRPLAAHVNVRTISPGGTVTDALVNVYEAYLQQQQHDQDRSHCDAFSLPVPGPFVRMTSSSRSAESRNGSPPTSQFGSPALCPSASPVASLDDGLLTPLADSMQQLDPPSEEPFTAASWVVHVSTTGAVVVLTLVVSFILPSISTVLGLLGGVCGVMQMYVFPGIVLVRNKNLRSFWQRTLILVGFAIGTFVGTSSVILSIL